MLNIYNKHPNISLSDFTKEGNTFYKSLNSKFAITNIIWKSLLDDIKKKDITNSIDLILRRPNILEGYQYFKVSYLSYNPFIK